ncbi:MAG TPA: hypothetical protein DEP04_00720 [Dehalococcoidia bacterium]|nr:hypothetical protein [Chloroflexota bacterium]HCE75124.1 hypothetical protein [Dehalococcoidia bacterium]|tara:strand:- start:8809 stop:9039 length:231 start_codon:yes stop_codon:yes gene_type:complete
MKSGSEPNLESNSGWSSSVMQKVKGASVEKGLPKSETAKIRGVFGGDSAKTNVLEKGAISRIKAKFGKLKIFKIDK